MKMLTVSDASLKWYFNGLQLENEKVYSLHAPAMRFIG